MYSKLDIELIRVFGRKELTEGLFFIVDSKVYRLHHIYGGMYYYDNSQGFLLYKTEHEILGHIPHLEDVFRVAKEEGMSYFELNDDTMEFWNELGIQKDSMSIPYSPTLPLLEQSEETKQALITLFEPGNS